MDQAFRTELDEVYKRLLLQEERGEAWNSQLFENYLLVEDAKSLKRLQILFDPMRQVPVVFTHELLMDEWPGLFSQSYHPLTGEVGYSFHLCGMTDQTLYDQVHFVLELLAPRA